ncbi:TB2/DP1 protein family protein [Aphelenchoides avenae]|nr:TB2/DP1 protein family protein [Aphelenchus avenae]KAH7727625.1 TB2/DP1 protein family protein [Aphelenchus avenae]
MPVPPQVQKFIGDVDKALHEPGKFTDTLGQVEAKTNVKRIYTVGALVALHALYLVFGCWAELLCNIIGFVYPAYISIKAIETATKEDDTQWLTYWVVFALLNVVEFFSATITHYMPFYWLLKCAFLLYLYLPMTLGAHKLYLRFIRPFHEKHSARIDGALSGAADRARQAFDQHVKPN